MKIWYDLDGTIADLYGVEGWLEALRAEDPTPYEIARPLVNLSRLARYLNRLQKMGHEICVISWLSKNSTPEYDALVTSAKMFWLSKHLPSVRWEVTPLPALPSRAEIPASRRFWQCGVRC